MTARSPPRSAATPYWACSSIPKRASITASPFSAASSTGGPDHHAFTGRSVSLSLIVFPAIDLKNGQVVRLAEGDMDRATIYGDDPAAQAMLFADAGAQHLHVVDLDGAFAGEAVNQEAVEAI